MNEQKPVALKRELGLFDSTMIVVGSMIGSGIFLVSADIARSLGSPAWLILTWVITGLITLMAALSYGELAGMMPKAGGQYVYLREAYSPLIGFLYGWSLFLVIQTGTIAAVAAAFAIYCGVLFPWFSTHHIILVLGPIQISTAQLLAVASIILLTSMNSRGLKTGKFVQLVFTVTKIIALAGLILAGIFIGKNVQALSTNFHVFWQQPFSMVQVGDSWVKNLLHGPSVWLVFGGAMVGSLFSSDAWNNITFTAGEVKDPQRNIPLSLLLGTLTVTIIYVLANVAYLLVLPMYGHPDAHDVLGRGIMFASDKRVATATAEVIFGQRAVLVMAVLIMISTFGCNNGLIMAGARVYYAMACDRLFFKSASRLNAQSVPSFALIIQCVWACFLCLSGSYSALLDFVIFAVLIFYVLTVAGIIVLRYKQPDTIRPYKAWGYPFIPVLYIVLASAIAADLLIVKWETSRWGALIVLLGIPVYYIARNTLSTQDKTTVNGPFS